MAHYVAPRKSTVFNTRDFSLERSSYSNHGWSLNTYNTYKLDCAPGSSILIFDRVPPELGGHGLTPGVYMVCFDGSTSSNLAVIGSCMVIALSTGDTIATDFIASDTHGNCTIDIALTNQLYLEYITVPKTMELVNSTAAIAHAVVTITKLS